MLHFGILRRYQNPTREGSEKALDEADLAMANGNTRFAATILAILPHASLAFVFYVR